MKNNYIIFKLIIYFFAINFCLAQNYNSRKLIQHDSIFFKKITNSKSKTLCKTRRNYSFPDTNLIFYNVKLNKDTLGVEIFDKNNKQLKTSKYILNNYHNYTLLNTSELAYNKRFFICPGLSIYEEDTSMGSNSTNSVLYVFELVTYDSIRFLNYKNNFSAINQLYASGFSYFDSGGGYTGITNTYGSYTFTNNDFIITASYGVNDGDLLHFMDGKYNTSGHLFRSHYFGAGITTLTLVNSEWEFLNNLSWESWELHPILFDGTSPISINHKPNYFITTASSDLWNKPNDKYLIFDLENLILVDSFNTTHAFEKIWHDSTGTFYFENYSDSNAFIIDHFRYLTKEISIENTMSEGDTIGNILNCNIFGSNLRFYGNNTIFKIDSLNGTITLNTEVNTIGENHTILNYSIHDGYFTDTASIVIDIPATISDSKQLFSIYPNPAKSVINITNNKKHDNYSLYLIDLNGKIVYQTEFSEFTKINTTNYINGIYLLSIKNSKSSYCKKIIIK